MSVCDGQIFGSMHCSTCTACQWRSQKFKMDGFKNQWRMQELVLGASECLGVGLQRGAGAKPRWVVWGEAPRS